MNKAYSIGSQLDEICYKLEQSAKLIDFAHVTFTQGDTEPEKEDFEALYFIYETQRDLIKQLRDLSETLCSSKGATA